MCLTEISLLPRELSAGRDRFPAENSLPMGISGTGWPPVSCPMAGRRHAGCVSQKRDERCSCSQIFVSWLLLEATMFPPPRLPAQLIYSARPPVLQEISQTRRHGARRADPETGATARGFSKQDGGTRSRESSQHWDRCKTTQQSSAPRNPPPRNPSVCAVLPPIAKDFSGGDLMCMFLSSFSSSSSTT